jgi:phosphoribosylglycinamide formyltransferase 2
VVYARSESADLEGDDTQTERATQALSDALAVPETDVRIFGHPKSYPRRRLGVALATAADVKTARERVHEAATALRRFW